MTSLLIKVGLFKQFLKTLNKVGKAFEYIYNMFAPLSKTEIESGTFTGTDVHKILQSQEFEE